MSEPKEQPKLDLDLGTAFLPSWAQKSAKENPYAKYEDETMTVLSVVTIEGMIGLTDRTGNALHALPIEDGSPMIETAIANGVANAVRRDVPPDLEAKAEVKEEDNAAGVVRVAIRIAEEGPVRRHRTRQEIIASLPSLKVTILPDSKGVESLAKQIRVQGRAYPLFDIAALVLKRPDRFRVSTTLQPDGKGQAVSEQWRCTLDDTLWLNQAEAIDHVLNQHFDQYYEKLKTETDPPKGNFTFVAQCGISGKILGPPNYHGYQDALRALHAERFSRMNFDAYKDRVKIVREEETVKKWVDEQSWKTQYKSKANPDSEPIDTWEGLIEDYKAQHLEASLETSKTLTIMGSAALKTPSRPVQELIRFHVEDQRRFPLQVATVLSQMFARQGLQFFKVNRTITHVSVARPKFLDMNETPVSEGVQKIVEFIDATPDCTRKKLLDALKPATATPAATTTPTPAESTTSEEQAEAAATDNSADAPPALDSSTAASPEETAIITDLHWLIHQGHVIEFSNGKMETAKKPAVRPAKSEQTKAADSPAPKAGAAEAEATAAQPSQEAAPAPATSQPEAPAESQEPPSQTETPTADKPAAEPPAAAESEAQAPTSSPSPKTPEPPAAASTSEAENTPTENSGATSGETTSAADTPEADNSESTPSA